MNTSSEKKIKHLEFIQVVINRLAQNSFMLKGWTVTLLAAIFVFANKSDNMDKAYLWIALVPILFFWSLDGYFLQQERLFRHLYNYVRSLQEEDIDFSMRTDNFHVSESNLLGNCFSKSLALFYLPIMAVVLIALSIF